MAWSVSAEHERFDEASDYFRKLVPYTREQYDQLDAKARRNAFWISGGLELAVVQQVHDEVAKAIEQGTPLEEFKQAVKERLQGAHGPDGFHLETVFRNAAQRAYNTGRWYQLTDPEMVLLRPYLLYDSVLDSRTTPICKALDGTCKLHDDPFWLTHHPLLHHLCRASLRSLRTKEALRRGVTNVPPEVQVPAGWGAAPPMASDEADLKPRQARFAPDVWQAFTKRDVVANYQLEKAQKKAKEKSLAERMKDPAHWVSLYEPKYGKEAARRMAWGRAMVERAGALPASDFVDAFNELAQQANLPKAGGYTARKIEQYAQAHEKRNGGTATMADVLAEMRRQRTQYADTIEVHMALLGHGRSVKIAKAKPAQFSYSNDYERIANLEEAKRTHAKARAFFERMTDASVSLRWDTITVVERGNKRAHIQRWSENKYEYNLGDNTHLSVAVHELSHTFDHWNGTSDLARDYVLGRARPGAPRKLTDITGERSFEDHELALEDTFINPYVGKVYAATGKNDTDYRGKWRASEFLAMHTQEMVSSPGRLTMSGDTDGMFLSLGILAGKAVP